MAKALMGHLGGPDARTTAELVALRRRVRELEAEVLRLRADAVVAAGDDLVVLDDIRPEPVPA